jgi:hypothetical protein
VYLNGTIAPPPPPSAITYQPIDGGPTYFASHFTNAGASWADSHILLGGWNEQPVSSTQVRYDTALGNNTYFNLAGRAGSDTADYDVLRAGGMHGFFPSKTPHSGSETIGFFGIDEADGDYGTGTTGWAADRNHWNTSDCIPSYFYCGLTAANYFYSGANQNVTPAGSKPGYWPKNDANGNHPVMQELTKPVVFAPHDGTGIADAQQFLTYSDVSDADIYWFIDGDLRAALQGGCAFFPTSQQYCTGAQHGYDLTLSQAQAELPANYEWQVKSLRALNHGNNGRSVPIVGTVEAGTCKWSSGGNPASQPCVNHNQYVAAAWHTMIAGARGLIWFVEDMGPIPTCDSWNVFYDGQDPSSSSPCSGLSGHTTTEQNGETFAQTDSHISAVNHWILHYESVLLSPTATNYVRSTTGTVSTLAKSDSSGGFYVFAGSGTPGNAPPSNQPVTFTLNDNYTGPVSVDGPTGSESRTVQATTGVFTDTFADEYAIHIYHIPS